MAAPSRKRGAPASNPISQAELFTDDDLRHATLRDGDADVADEKEDTAIVDAVGTGLRRSRAAKNRFRSSAKTGKRAARARRGPPSRTKAGQIPGVMTLRARRTVMVFPDDGIKVCLPEGAGEVAMAKSQMSSDSSEEFYFWHCDDVDGAERFCTRTRLDLAITRDGAPTPFIRQFEVCEVRRIKAAQCGLVILRPSGD
jgi:hypothetical protein